MSRANDEPVTDLAPMPSRQLSSTANTLALPMLLTTGVTAILDADAVLDTYDLTLEVGEGAAVNVGDLIEVFNTVTFMQATVLSKPTADVLRLDSLINHAYPAGSVLNVSTGNMVVNGSVTPQVFSIKPEPSQRGRFSRIVVSMIATANMDTGTFGPIAALTRGVMLRVKQADGDYRNLYTIKTNAGFKAYSYDGSFDPNNAQGDRMFTTRLTWGGQDKHDAVIEIDGSGIASDDVEIQMVIQDNLVDASFSTFTAIAEGREV